jgi:hypothetical protein
MRGFAMGGKTPYLPGSAWSLQLCRSTSLWEKPEPQMHADGRRWKTNDLSASIGVHLRPNRSFQQTL